MLKRLLKILLYVGPALVVLVAFAIGHLMLSPEVDRLKTYQIENGLIEPEPAPEPEPDPAPTEDAAADGPAPEMMPDGKIVPPSYRYFSFMTAFTGNVGDTRRLYSLEISVSIFETPMRADGIVLRLTEMESQLRPYVIATLEGITEEQVRSGEERNRIAAEACEALNAAFKDLGEDITLKAAVITNFVLT